MAIIRNTPDEHSSISFLRKFSDEQLFDIWLDACKYKWPELLGPEPVGFSALPEDRPGGRKGKKIKKTKADYTRPIEYLAYDLLGDEKVEAVKYLRMNTEQRLICDFLNAVSGERIADIEELSAHLAKTLDL